LINRKAVTRAFYLAGLAFIASATVFGAAALTSGTADSADTAGVVGQALLIAAIVGLGATLWPDRRTAAHAGGTGTGHAKAGTPCPPADCGAGRGDSPLMRSLEEQGITVKLLELKALGDRYGNIFSVAMIGLDHLDEIAARAGRKGTSELLHKVTSALAHTLRMPDRVGELDRGRWLVVLPETRLPGAIQIAERLRGAVSGLEVQGGERILLQTTASVGVTSFRRGDDLHSLLDRAGKALDEAQNQGRNRVLPDLAA